MKKLSILSVLILSLLLSFSFNPALAADVEPENVDLAIVDSFAVTEEDADIMFEDISKITEELGYELVVDTIALEWYLEEETETITNFAFEDVTEEYNEITADMDDIEDIEDLVMDEDELNEIESPEESTVILDITDEVIAEIAD